MKQMFFLQSSLDLFEPVMSRWTLEAFFYICGYTFPKSWFMLISQYVLPFYQLFFSAIVKSL